MRGLFYGCAAANNSPRKRQNQNKMRTIHSVVPWLNSYFQVSSRQRQRLLSHWIFTQSLSSKRRKWGAQYDMQRIHIRMAVAHLTTSHTMAVCLPLLLCLDNIAITFTNSGLLYHIRWLQNIHFLFKVFLRSVLCVARQFRALRSLEIVIFISRAALRRQHFRCCNGMEWERSGDRL